MAISRKGGRGGEELEDDGRDSHCCCRPTSTERREDSLTFLKFRVSRVYQRERERYRKKDRKKEGKSVCMWVCGSDTNEGGSRRGGRVWWWKLCTHIQQGHFWKIYTCVWVCDGTQWRPVIIHFFSASLLSLSRNFISSMLIHWHQCMQLVMNKDHGITKAQIENPNTLKFYMDTYTHTHTNRTHKTQVQSWMWMWLCVWERRGLLFCLGSVGKEKLKP